MEGPQFILQVRDANGDLRSVEKAAKSREAVDIATAKRLPTMFPDTEAVTRGALAPSVLGRADEVIK